MHPFPTVAEVAAMFRISLASMYNLVAQGRIRLPLTGLRLMASA